MWKKKQTNFNRKFKDEKSMCQDGSKESERRSVTEQGRDVSKRFGKKLKKTQTFSTVSSPAMKLGSFNTTQKPNDNQCSGKLSKTNTGTNVKIQDQDNARRFLRYSRKYYDSVRTTWSNLESDVLH
jgi:glutamate/tyrosine decarboxylase-like PLP-dependent enzyme